MQTQTATANKYKKGDILRMTSSLKYRVDKVSNGKYTLLPINIYPDGKIVYEYGYEMDAPFAYIDNDKYLTLDNYSDPAFTREFECEVQMSAVPKCECGAHKVGYTKPSRHHYGWCPFYKE